MQKYKVFINDKWIFFGEFNKNQFVENEEYKFMDVNKQNIFKLAEMIKTRSLTQNVVFNKAENIKEIFDQFLSHFLVLEAAGGIVLNSKNAFLMIKRFGVWDFPKGKIEKGEGIEEAAIREVQEETAVKNLKIIRELPSVYHIYSYGINWIVKRTFWFLMQTDYNGIPEPQIKEDILEAVWIPKVDVPFYLSKTHGNLKELVKESGILDDIQQ